jgi:hypothetical protein
MQGEIIAKKLHSIGNTLSGVLKSPEIQKKLGRYGYTNERILVGKNLWDKTNSLMTKQVKEYGNQYAATDEQEKFFSSTYSQYMIVVKIGRVVFKKQPDMLATLGLTGFRSRSLSGWLRDARILYGNILDTPSALEAMTDFGFTAQQFQDELQNVQKLEDLHSNLLIGKSAAQQATQERDKAFDELCDWYSDFRAVIRVALYDNPQLLEALGIRK